MQVTTVNVVNDLRQLSTNNFTLVQTLGQTSVGDGNARLYRANLADTSADNGTTIIAPVNNNGRFDALGIALSNPNITGGIITQANIPTVQGKFKNFSSSANGNSNNVSMTCDEIVLEDGGNNYVVNRNVSLTLNLANSNANGLDTGSLLASTWYSTWIIYNPTTATVASLGSTSATAPTMPSGYTYKARVGWVRTDSSGSKFPLSFKQYNDRTKFVVSAGTNITAINAGPMTMASGVAGTIGVTLVAVATGNYVPSTASHITAGLVTAGTSTAEVFPSNNVNGVILYAQNASPVGTFAEFLLESTNIYWASNNAGNFLYCYGWKDNL